MEPTGTRLSLVLELPACAFLTDAGVELVTGMGTSIETVLPIKLSDGDPASVKTR